MYRMAIGDGEKAGGDNQIENDVNSAGGVSLEEQKECLKRLLQTPMSKGETWYLLDSKWFKQWKRYVGYDSWDKDKPGMESMNPGPIDNSGLFKDDELTSLRRHLIDEFDYVVLPTDAWEKLEAWYGLSVGQTAIARQVVEHGMFVKYCKVEVYLVELKLCHNNDMETYQITPFSRADNIGHVESVMRRLFEIAENKETRIWNKYMSNTYELLAKKDQSIQDCGLYDGQVVVIEEKKDDGTWTREISKSFTFASSPSKFQENRIPYKESKNTGHLPSGVTIKRTDMKHYTNDTSKSSSHVTKEAVSQDIWLGKDILQSERKMPNSGDVQRHLADIASGKNTGRQKLAFDPTTGKLKLVNEGHAAGDNVVCTDMAEAGFFILAWKMEETTWRLLTWRMSIASGSVNCSSIPTEF